jgi:CBS domain-containing protein
MVDAAHVLLQRKIGCLPVVEHDTLVGIVTDMDLPACISGDGTWRIA